MTSAHADVSEALAVAARALTLAEACTALGVSTSTLRRWADAGRIKVVRTAGGHRRFPLDEIRRLNGSHHSNQAVAVRPTPPPAAAMPAVAKALAARGEEILRVATAALYRDGRPGWFAGAEARPALSDWMEAVASGCESGAMSTAVRASDALLATACLAGTPVLERDVFLERFFDVVARAVVAAGGSRDEAVAVQRLARSLRHRSLVLADSR